MKTPTKTTRSNRALLLSILCAGVATFLGGCAEGPYMTSYDTGYYPTAYYTTPTYYTTPAYRTYSYYEPTYYDNTIVRSGVRYNDAYGPRYYGSYYGY